MKPDKLEKFISENRKEFDNELPSPEIWGKISADIKQEKNIGWRNILWKAAAVVIIFSASWFFHDIIDKTEESEQIRIAGNADPETRKELEALMDAQAYYSSRIGTTQKQVYKLAGTNSHLMNELDEEFSQLDQIMKELQRDLQDNAATEEVVEAMIQNYRAKLMILEEVLQQLREKQSEENNEENEYSI